ncbi:hypothetical protein [Lacipirellula parvula]|uniref:Peptidase C51 domain-containing protein n=1 Tax=Lacipirellula parvula TaxID=2650471 RepID=A0A5K7XNP6_9BACT|nr:hypothetical protein [Lacipirellula parvula]BBO34819.1 hypothetical protein PLANPX_4431 [Lacipirellula parvula]
MTRIILTCGLLMLWSPGLAPLQAAQPAKPGDDVVAAAREIPDGGTYVWAGESGVPHDIRHDGALILKAQKKGTFCSGFTFTVAMEAARDRGLLRGKSADAVRQFQQEWYGSSEEAAERQCALAVERLGIGHEVKSLDEVQPGDFVQIWRTNKTGHSVLFLEWVREGGEAVGIKYRSSQKSTDGVGDRVEYFADAQGHDGKVDRRRIYIARLDPKLE